MNLPSFFLDVASLFASDPDRGRRVLELMKRHDLALDADWIGQMQAYAREVYDGKQPIPKRLG